MTLKEKIQKIKSRNNLIRYRIIQAKRRSIRTTWTREMIYEISSQHGIEPGTRTNFTSRIKK